MSIEKLTYRALVQTVAGKVVADVFGGAASILHAAGRTLDDIGNAAFLVEYDGARQYRTLTETDLGVLQNQPDRYADEETAFVVIDEEPPAEEGE